MDLMCSVIIGTEILAMNEVDDRARIRMRDRKMNMTAPRNVDPCSIPMPPQFSSPSGLPDT